MSLDLVGIENVGEFYSNHYLEALLEDDLKGIFKEWKRAEKEEGVRRPWKKLYGLAEDWFEARALASEASSDVERWRVARSIHVPVLEALGYEYRPAAKLLKDERSVPVLLADTRDGNPWLWVVDAPFPADEDGDSFDQPILSAQYPDTPDSFLRSSREATDDTVPEDFQPPETWRDFLDRHIFQLDDPPRWVLFMAGADLYLIDRHKWGRGKYLHFSLSELFGRREARALKASCGLLHRDVINPEESVPLVERLDEKSHKHAYSVSTDLKHGAQQAIELLANEAIYYRKHVSKERIYNRDKELADQLTGECLTYLYRLLFLFYVEARGGELGIVPMKSDAYRKGYSLEKLRDLEMVPLNSEQARNGYYISDSLRKLFEIVDRGFNTHGSQNLLDGISLEDDTFAVHGLRSALFDEERTPFLRPVRFRNVVMQQVLQLLSLSAPEKGKERGRISYAQLGINQLGAVYEGLLSYTGFFADETLYEVRAAGDIDDEDARTWFVPAGDIDKYEEDEIVKNDDGDPVKHERGTFIFRLAGRDREKSASYYTPEVLTECLTKYTLKERLGEGIEPQEAGEGADGQSQEGSAPALTADEILELTICEPAMGSGAFLNEAIDQLAEAYLQRKQDELARQYRCAEDKDPADARIPPDEYRHELQKVKHYLAVNNAYGVDLNPMATELGKVSLWLNVLHEGARAPWFDMRLSVGNSLIGARRAVYHRTDLLAKKGENWLHQAPDLLSDSGLTSRPSETIYHFLLPAAGMCPFDSDKVFRQLEPENTNHIKRWRKDFTASNLNELDVEQLQRLSARVDELFGEHLAARRNVLDNTRQPHDVWGQPDPEDDRWKTIDECEEWTRELHRPNAPGRKLKLAMDYWSALWFWPVRKAGLLPTRDEFWIELSAILNGGSLDELVATSERLQLVRELADRYHFFHWELEFPEVFADQGGFDVVLGNPPWIDVAWKERGVLSDIEPLVGVRKLSQKKAADRRDDIFDEHADAEERYLDDGERVMGTAQFLSQPSNYQHLRGHKANTYKNFILRGWTIAQEEGRIGLIHPDGVYDDPRGGQLREEIFPRLVYRFHFRNELRLFDEVHHETDFSLNVFAGEPKDLSFTQIGNLFHPVTVGDSFHHDGRGAVPGIKDDKNNWELRGHRHRIIEFNRELLGLASELFNSADAEASGSMIPVFHSREIPAVVEAFRAVKSLGGPGDNWTATREWHEGERQDDGTIKRETKFPERSEEMVFSGPSIFVGTPLYKTPNEDCSNNLDYSPIELEHIPDDFLPRTNYVPNVDRQTYAERSPTWKGQKFWNYFRHGHREYVGSGRERTFSGALLPAGTSHVHAIISMAFDRYDDLLLFNGLSSSICYDFFAKVTGKEHLNVDFVSKLPFDVPDELAPFIRARTARLNCLTTHYRELWEDTYNPAWREDEFTVEVDEYPQLTPWAEEVEPQWHRRCALRNRFERRRALVELDALAALALGLTADELCTIYRVQFPVLREYEKKTYYDQRGKIVYSRKANMGVVGIGEFRKIRDAESKEEMLAAAREKYHDDLRDFEPPFLRCDREVDMRQAYEEFQRRVAKKSEKGSGAEVVSLRDERPAAEQTFEPRPIDAELFQVALRAKLPAEDVPELEEIEQKLEQSSDRDPDDIVPYANDIQQMRFLLVAGQHTDEPEEAAAAIDLGKRAWYRYLELARWFELIERRHGRIYLTETGIRFLNSGQPYAVLRPIIERRRLIREIKKAPDWPEHEWQAIKRAVENTDNISGASVERRAHEVHRILSKAGLAAQRPLDLEGKSTTQGRSSGSQGLDTEVESDPHEQETRSKPPNTTETSERVRDESAGHAQKESEMSGDDAVADLQSGSESESTGKTNFESNPDGDGQVEVVPQANGVETLTRLLEGMALGMSQKEHFARRIDGSERTVDYYLQLGRWLDFIDENEPELTERGEQFVSNFDERDELYTRALYERRLVREITDSASFETVPEETAALVIERCSGLSSSTASRRAGAMVRLIEEAGDPPMDESTPVESSTLEQMPSVEALPVDVLGVPGLISAAVQDLDVQTVGDALDLGGESELRKVSGIGPKKAQLLAELGEKAEEMVDAAVGEESVDVLVVRLAESGVDLEAPWRQVLTDAPTRAKSRLEEAGIETVGELAVACRSADLTAIDGLGRGTVDKLVDQLNTIACEGMEVYRYGPGGRPRNVAELSEHILDSLDSDGRDLFRMRYEEGKTLGEIGDFYDITREAVRQRLLRCFEEVRPTYEEVAEELLAEVMEVLDGDVGLIHRSQVVDLTGCADLYRVVLGVILLDPDAYLWENDFIATDNVSSFRSHLSDLQGKLREMRGLRIPLSEGLRIARSAGFELNEEGLRDLLAAELDLHVDARGTFRNPRATKGDKVAHVLKRAQRPLDLEGIARRFEAEFADDDEDVTHRGVQPYAKRHPHIYTVGRGEYVHRDALPVEPSVLDEAVERCLDWLRDKAYPLSTKYLLEQLEEIFDEPTRLEGLNWYLLRDVLLRHSKVSGFRNTFNVAWEPNYDDDGLRLIDRVERALRDADGWCNYRDIIEQFPEGFEVNPRSVEYYLHGHPFAVHRGDETFIHRDNLQVDDTDTLVNAAVELVDEEDGVVSTVTLVTRLSYNPKWRDFTDSDAAPDLLWSLLRHDDRVQTGSQRLVGPAGSKQLLAQAIIDALDDIAPVYPREVDDAIDTRFGFDVDDLLVKRTLRELYNEGKVDRLPNALYYPIGLSETELMETLANRDQEVRECARWSNAEQFDDEDLWLLARYFRWADRLVDAKKVLDILVGRDEVEEEWEEMREEVVEELRGLLV